MSSKGVLPIIERLFPLGSTQDVALKGVLPAFLEESSVELRHEVRALTVALLAQYQSLVLDSKNDGSNLFVSCNLFVKEIGFTAFAEIVENLSGNLTAGEHGRLGLVPLLH